MSNPHPLDPLTPQEISKAAEVVRDTFHGFTPCFRVITLREPAKHDMIGFLEAENLGHTPSFRPPRIARVQVIVRGQSDSNELFELLIDLNSKSIEQKEHLVGKHAYIDTAYMQDVEKACRADPRIQDEIKKLNLPEGASVVIEPWAYATDGMNDMSKRTTMCWFYARLLRDPDANYYAYPLELCAEVSEELQVTRIYYLPSSEGQSISEEARPFDRNKCQSPQLSEYHPKLRPPPRTTTKPYQVVQPQGPSFKFDGNLLSWEKWTLRVGFNYREGLILHDIRYDGRSLFYRLSLSEMFVPYGDPRCPYPRKAAFDLGNDGAGINANNLRLGCDCLGVIKYFDGWHNTTGGEPLKLPNVICCHEQDDGILWKHTNFRTHNAVVTRSRILVLQTIITVSNYEYIFAFHLGQDASIRYEVRATGILSTAPIDIGDRASYGTVVAPGVLAPYHQHLFCLRIDPAIDGTKNTLQIEESHTMPTDESTNPFGVGYMTRSTIVEEECGLDLDFTINRVFKIINEEKLNPVNGAPVGFKLVPCYSQLILAGPQSYHSKRSEFGSHAVWITRYQDDELFPAGRHTMQSLGSEGISSVIEKRKKDASNTSVRNQDIVIWHTFGSTHNPRIEDWPVMPSEKMMVGLVPSNFFLGNPALDVAVSEQENNRTRVKFAAFQQNVLNRVMYPIASNDTGTYYWLKERAEQELSNREGVFLAVIDLDKDEEVVACARWNIPAKFMPEPEHLPPKDANHVASYEFKTKSSANEFLIPPCPEGTNLRLQTRFRAILCQQREKHYSPENDYAVGALYTHPNYQRRGCASAILRWGTQLADANCARIYLESTPQARRLYLNHGWKLVEQSAIDLSEFGVDASYDIGIMIREPRSS
ncbi:hypothetical protein CNMCM5878_003944 [Aspergillus fumigatiaffinis]|nr:hypothetical protein CNMCM5878_003944 [Aspergillus fumigatiaffinis]